MGLSALWDDSLAIIYFQQVKTWLRINLMGRSYPCKDPIEIIDLDTVKIIARD